MPRRVPVALLGLAFVLLGAAWVIATEPFDAPDEVSHYLRAMNISNGTLLGPKVPYPLPLIRAQQAWVQHDTRGVLVSPRLAPPEGNCLTGRPDYGPRSCLEATEAGNYHPLPYLLPAVAVAVSPKASTALWVSRAASLAQCLLFILMAIALLWNGSPWSLIGLLTAITPMVLFVSSVVNPNGLEIAASLAFAAAVLRLSRDPTSASRSWVWAAFAVSGAVTILSWQLGPVFAGADLLLLGGLLGRPGLRRLTSVAGKAAWVSGAILALATIVWLVYGLASGLDHASFGLTPLAGAIHGGLRQLGPVLSDSVGTFGTVSVHLPLAARWIWWLLVLALIGLAIVVGTTRERVVMTVTTAVALAFPVLFFAWVYRFSGFGMQGRYMLPLIVLIPLVAGEVIYRRVDRLPAGRGARVALGGVLILIAGFQAYAWWYDAAVVAGKPGSLGFYAHAGWSPPLGWVTWIAVVVAGTAALLGFAAVATLGSGRGARPSRAAT